MTDALRIDHDGTVDATDSAIKLWSQSQWLYSGPLASKTICFEFSISCHDQHAAMTLLHGSREQREKAGDILLSGSAKSR